VPENEPAPFDTESFLPILRKFPEALERYEELKAERDRLLEQERKHVAGAMRFLRRRGNQREIKELWAERETCIREVTAAFQESVRALVKGLLIPKSEQSGSE
jgi:hypothetical protein